MTEYDMFVENIPVIAEIIVYSRGSTEEQYQQWKQEFLNKIPEETKRFAKKTLHVIDMYR